MHEFIREHGSKFQYVLYRGWNNHLNDATQPLREWERDTVAGVERTLREDAPTLIEDVQVNVPALCGSLTPIDGMGDVCSLFLRKRRTTYLAVTSLQVMLW